MIDDFPDNPPNRLDLSSEPGGPADSADLSLGSQRLSSQGLSSQGQSSQGQSSQGQGRRFVGIHFVCCDVYARVYINRDQSAYEGRCPRCLRTIRLPIGPGGTDSRFFTAY